MIIENLGNPYNHRNISVNCVGLTPMPFLYSYVYDKERCLVQTSFPPGNQVNNVYDKTRLVQIQTPEGNIDLNYSCGTRLSSILKDTESIVYEYDGSLLTSETLGGTLTQTLSYTYNNDFDLQSFSYSGNTHTYGYDDEGLLTAAGAYTIARNAQNGLPEAVTGGGLNLARTFNGYGELDIQSFTVGGQGLTSWNLTRDDNGRITNKTETVEGVTANYVYTYDPMGRLLTVTKDGVLVEEYQYNSNGTGTRTYEMNTLRDIAGRAMAYSDEDHLLTAGGTIYQYDVDGFLAVKTYETDETLYEYSSRGELLSVTLPDSEVIEYTHDPLGRRIAKKIDGAVTEKYLWQGLTRLLAVYDGSDNLVMRFEYIDSRMPVAMTKEGTTYYLTYDQVGSLRIIADVSGNVVKRINYDSFGNIIEDTDPTFQIPFGFAGGLHDRDTGLVRFGFRDYDPDVGRWTAKDPILFSGGDTDLYGYCINDPVNLIDPYGLLGWDVVGTISIAAGTATLGVTATISAPIWVPIAGAGLVVGGIAALIYDAISSVEMVEIGVDNITKQMDEKWKEVEEMKKEYGPCK
jgi:RHS repeat-associated protein